MRGRERLYVAAVLLASLLFATQILGLALSPARTPRVEGRGGTGRPRAVDLERLRRRIREGRLSDHPARHARPR